MAFLMTLLMRGLFVLMAVMGVFAGMDTGNKKKKRK